VYLRDLERSIAIIEEALPQKYEEFAHLPQIIKDGIFKRTEHAIELIFDIMGEIIRARGLETPKDDYNIVDILQGNGIITLEEARTLKAMRGFRNVLVHVYEDLNEEEAYENIKSGLRDLKKFLEKFRGESGSSSDASPRKGSPGAT